MVAPSALKETGMEKPRFLVLSIPPWHSLQPTSRDLYESSRRCNLPPLASSAPPPAHPFALGYRPLALSRMRCIVRKRKRLSVCSTVDQVVLRKGRESDQMGNAAWRGSGCGRRGGRTRSGRRLIHDGSATHSVTPPLHHHNITSMSLLHYPCRRITAIFFVLTVERF